MRRRSRCPGPKSLDEVDPEILRTYEKLGIPLREQEILAGVVKPQVEDGEDDEGRLSQPSGRVAVDAVFDSVSVATTFKKELAEGRRDLHADLRGDPRASGTRAQISRLRGPDLRQLLRDAELRGLHGRLLRLRAEGRSVPDGAVDLFPDQREEHRPVRAHADHRRRRAPTSPISRAARRRSATRTSCMPRSSSWSRWTMPRSSTPPSRTGSRATRRARAASTTSSPSVATAAARTPASPGRRSRPARRSPGNTRPASSGATIRAASSTRSPCRTGASRSIPAPR